MLPEPIREAINNLLKAGATYDDIVGYLRSINIDDVSRAAIGRHGKSWKKTRDNMRRSNDMMIAFAKEFGEDGDSEAMQALIQMGQTVAFQQLQGVIEGEEDLGAKDMHDMLKALWELARARGMTVDVEAKLRQQFQAQARKDLESAVGSGQIDAEAAQAARDALGF